MNVSEKDFTHQLHHDLHAWLRDRSLTLGIDEDKMANILVRVLAYELSIMLAHFSPSESVLLDAIDETVERLRSAARDWYVKKQWTSSRKTTQSPT